ncbi:MAG TPA: MmgE/PrpD family protein [Parvularculaceae bacterium]|nr:MmgE/PrpD family protein [Amphiplicatus sp.]HPE29681.1 MmgE/PrpD family protein [Parvularculaceae bacterium]
MHHLISYAPGTLTRRTLLTCSAAAWCVHSMAEAHAAEASIAGAIASAAARLPPAPPAEVAERTAWTLADVMGAMLYASTLPEAIEVAQFFARGSRSDEAFVPATDLSATEMQAAAATAFLIHAAEIDDSDLRGQLRASAVIMSSSLAAAQAANASGVEFLRAAALGYTLQGRFAAPVGAIQAHGWMASGVWGPPAGAAAVALLRRQSAEELASAISLAGAASGGLFQYYFDQTEEKRLIVARAARAAVESAELAELGERGASRIIEGKAGLFRLFGGVESPPADYFTAGLEALEGPLFVRPKYFSASHSIIPTLEGLIAAAPQGIDAAAVERVIIKGDPAWGSVIGAKINDFEAPVTPIGAALNFSFVIALWIIRGSVLPADYTDETMRDDRILNLARKFEFQTVQGEHLSIEVQMKSGEAIRAAAADPSPDEPAPLETERRIAKFDGLAGARLTKAKCEDLREHCLSVGEARSMREWMRRTRAICA